MFGQILNLVSIGYGSLLILASSSALTIIFSSVFSVVILKEKFSKRDGVAVALIVSGSIVCMILSASENEN